MLDQTTITHISNMNRDELLELAERTFDALRNINEKGFRKGQKVLIKGKYAKHPNFVWPTKANGYEDFVGKIAYVDDVTIINEVDSVPHMRLRKSPTPKARYIDVHVDDIVPIE
ncbi:hypothetical protein NC797_07025 [Aquibacillus sp. 3ASR75-11]|uniref:Uncharacterized protein n=1 Tax=Terrihalobacillus insolitus TaxID=2950438 RepID=A0A9X3WRW7_9BACI|nr:hypothetical protein [Terrihalobacillus insolitus]MDC3424260.1 hypothetical protein [Terrihalobacillus insolitus]